MNQDAPRRVKTGATGAIGMEMLPAELILTLLLLGIVILSART